MNGMAVPASRRPAGRLHGDTPGTEQRLALLFPGQGSQRPGMLAGLPRSPAVTKTIEEAQDMLGPIDAWDTPEAFSHSTGSQVALFIAGAAAARSVTEEHGVRPGIVAGQSIGAFAAAVTAGVLTFAEALATVRLRGQLMDCTADGGRWGMAGILGLRRLDAGRLVTRVATDSEPLWLALVNSADQVVVSGSATALARCTQAARHAGARRVQRLDVAVASHCPLQAPTAQRVAEHLSRIPRRAQTTAYLTNTGGRRIRNDAAAVLDDLARSVAQPVQWFDAMRLMSELGVTHALQMPPGRVLIGLLPGSVRNHAAALDQTDYPRIIDDLLQDLRRPR
jgi:malonate decarboxylase epsilon subunit